MTTPTPPTSGHEEPVVDGRVEIPEHVKQMAEYMVGISESFLLETQTHAVWIAGKIMAKWIDTLSRPPHPVPTATPGGMTGEQVEIEMAFEDWQGRGGKSVYSSKPDLSSGDYHSGTVFSGTIRLDSEQHQELQDATKNGFMPVFRIFVAEIIPPPTPEA